MQYESDLIKTLGDLSCGRTDADDNIEDLVSTEVENNVGLKLFLQAKIIFVYKPFQYHLYWQSIFNTLSCNNPSQMTSSWYH